VRNKIVLFIIFACMHGIVTALCMGYGMGLGLARFDHPELPGASESSAVAAVNILLLPGRLVWTSWASKNLPNVIENLLFVANSGLWSLVGVAALDFIFRASRKPTRQDEQAETNGLAPPF
jgi:hypothetical protein